MSDHKRLGVRRIFYLIYVPIFLKSDDVKTHLGLNLFMWFRPLVDDRNVYSQYVDHHVLGNFLQIVLPSNHSFPWYKRNDAWIDHISKRLTLIWNKLYKFTKQNFILMVYIKYAPRANIRCLLDKIHMWYMKICLRAFLLCVINNLAAVCNAAWFAFVRIFFSTKMIVYNKLQSIF